MESSPVVVISTRFDSLDNRDGYPCNDKCQFVPFFFYSSPRTPPETSSSEGNFILLTWSSFLIAELDSFLNTRVSERPFERCYSHHNVTSRLQCSELCVTARRFSPGQSTCGGHALFLRGGIFLWPIQSSATRQLRKRNPTPAKREWGKLKLEQPARSRKGSRGTGCTLRGDTALRGPSQMSQGPARSGLRKPSSKAHTAP